MEYLNSTAVFDKTTRAFNYIYEKYFTEREIVILDMPDVSMSKRGVCDIGWQCEGAITLYGTLSSNPLGEDVIWEEIKEGQEINKTISAFKIIADEADSKIVIRVILR